MGHWGVRSYEIDEADEALDAAFERVHGALYEELMDDRNPLSLEEVQRRLANPRTLEAAIDHLREEFGPDLDAWDEVGRLAYAGVVVRHAELGVDIPSDVRERAASWLRDEDIEWEEGAEREKRRAREIALLTRSAG